MVPITFAVEVDIPSWLCDEISRTVAGRQPAEGLERWRAATDMPLLVLAVASLPILLLELARTELPYSDQLFLDIVNVVVLVAFAADYVVEFRLAKGKRNYMRGEWTNLFIVVSQVMALVPVLTGLGALRMLRAG